MMVVLMFIVGVIIGMLYRKTRAFAMELSQAIQANRTNQIQKSATNSQAICMTNLVDGEADKSQKQPTSILKPKQQAAGWELKPATTVWD